MQNQDWQWDGQAEVFHPYGERDGASIQIRAGDNSTATYLVPMVANEDGYEASMDVHLENVSVTSSLNDIRILSARECHVRSSFFTMFCLPKEDSLDISKYAVSSQLE
jgi:hypothetical protein